MFGVSVIACAAAWSEKADGRAMPGYRFSSSSISRSDRTASSSNAKPVAAVGLRCAYQRTASSASTRASSRYSSSRVTISGGKNPATRLRPRDGLGCPVIDPVQAPLNLDRPRRFGVFVARLVEALDQLPSERATFLSGELECLGEQLPRVHEQNSSTQARFHKHPQTPQARRPVSRALSRPGCTARACDRADLAHADHWCRSLDSIHVAAAVLLAAELLVTGDRRQATLGEGEGLSVRLV